MTIQVGDKIPEVTLGIMTESGPDVTSSSSLFKGKRVVVFGLPGAFTKTCSSQHLPGFVQHADAIKAKGGVQHVVYSSVANADVAPDAVGHFKSKLDVEDHLKASGLNYSILRPVAFFENYDDLNYFIDMGALTPENACVIRGAGVKLNKNISFKNNREIPTIALVARMLKDKGIYEFVAAVRKLKSQKINARFLLVGDIASLASSIVLVHVQQGTSTVVDGRPIVRGAAQHACCPQARPICGRGGRLVVVPDVVPDVDDDPRRPADDDERPGVLPDLEIYSFPLVGR